MECPCTSVQSRLGRHASPGPVFESEGVEFVVVSVAIGFLVNPLTKACFYFLSAVYCKKKKKEKKFKEIKREMKQWQSFTRQLTVPVNLAQTIWEEAANSGFWFSWRDTTKASSCEERSACRAGTTKAFQAIFSSWLQSGFYVHDTEEL